MQRGSSASHALRLNWAPPDVPIFPVPSLPPEIQLVFEDRPDYLYAKVSGPRDSQEISLAYWQLVAEQCRRRDTRHLLVYECLGEQEGERDTPAMLDAIIALGMDRLRIAFVVGNVDQLARLEHAEILATERGANGRVFASLAVAERWLRHGS